MKALKFIKNMHERMSRAGISIVSQTGDGPFFIGDDSSTFRDKIVAEQYERICKAFNLTDSDQMRKMFHDVTCGEGNEWMTINQLNSSALLSFLCFCGVGNEHRILIDGQDYNAVRFELRSDLKPCGRRHPVSNMDVVLLNTDIKKALFLESKFTEYLKPSKQLKVSSYYSGPKGRYKELLSNEEIGDNIFCKNGFWQTRNQEKVYLEGIKQMICHYLGIMDQVTAPDDAKWKSKDWEDIKNYDEIKLGEIVFKFDNCKDAFKSYSTAYNSLYKALNTYKLNTDINDEGKHKPTVTLRDKLLSYQEVFSGSNINVLNDIVGSFYCLGNEA